MTLDARSASGPGKPSWRGAIRGNVLMMGLVSLFTDFSSEMIYPLLPAFLAGLTRSPEATAIYVGLMEGVAEAAASLLKILSGRVSDKVGKRKVLVVIGYVLSALCRPLMALAGGPWHVVAMRFGDRVGKGIRTSPRDALIGDSVGPEYRGLAFSFHRAMDHAGAVLGPLTSIVVLYLFLHAFMGHQLWKGTMRRPGPQEMEALRWLFALALIPGLLAVIALVTRVREVAPAPDRSPELHGRPAPSAWRMLPRRFYLFVAIVTLFALGNSSDLFLLLYGQTRFELGLIQIIILWIALHVSKIIFSFPGGILSDKFGRRGVIIAGWFVYALVYLGMAVVAKEWQFWALFIVYGVFYGMTEGAEKALVADFVPSERRGTAYGVYHGAIGLAALPASLLFGVFWAKIAPQVAFGIGAGLAGAAAILLTGLLARKRPPHGPTT